MSLESAQSYHDNQPPGDCPCEDKLDDVQSAIDTLSDAAIALMRAADEFSDFRDYAIQCEGIAETLRGI